MESVQLMDQPRGQGQPGSVTSQRRKWTAGARLHCRLQQAPAAAALVHTRASSRLHESRKPALPDCAAPPNARRISHHCRSHRPFLTAPPTGRSARRAFDHTIAISIIHNRDCGRPTATSRLGNDCRPSATLALPNAAALRETPSYPRSGRPSTSPCRPRRARHCARSARRSAHHRSARPAPPQ